MSSYPITLRLALKLSGRRNRLNSSIFFRPTPLRSNHRTLLSTPPAVDSWRNKIQQKFFKHHPKHQSRYKIFHDIPYIMYIIHIPMYVWISIHSPVCTGKTKDKINKWIAQAEWSCLSVSHVMILIVASRTVPRCHRSTPFPTPCSDLSWA